MREAISLGFHAANLSQLRSYLADPGGLVPFAPIGNRGEKGRIGLDQHTIDGTLAATWRIASALGKVMLPAKEIRKPQSMARRACSHSPVKQCRIPPSPVRAHCALDHRQRVVPGIGALLGGAAMDHDRLACERGNLHLPREGLLLLFAGGVVIVVVQPDLAGRL